MHYRGAVDIDMQDHVKHFFFFNSISDQIFIHKLERYGLEYYWWVECQTCVVSIEL